jgi:hypothetical protein
MGLLLIIVLILLLMGSFPTWPHSRDWGYRGSGAVGVILLIVVLLVVLERIPLRF